MALEQPPYVALATASYGDCPMTPNDHVHWIELFYDLIHVVIIFLLGNYLSEPFVLWRFFWCLQACLWLFGLPGQTQASLTRCTSVPDVKHRMIMSSQIRDCQWSWPAAIPSIHGKGWMYFALAYSAQSFHYSLFVLPGQTVSEQS